MKRHFLAATLLCFLPPASHASTTEQTTAGPSNLRPIGSAVLDNTLEIEGAEIAAKKLRSRMTVETFVNGAGPYRFLVDSGADSSAIGQSLVAKMALETGSRALLHGVTESRVVNRVIVDELRFGTTATTDLELPVLDERDMGSDGIIGLDALVRQRLMLDFDKRVISVEDASQRRKFTGNVIVVTGRLQRGQLILTQVSANRQRVDAVVDTGSEITIGNMALFEKLKLREDSSLIQVPVSGVTGKEIMVDFAIVPELKIGSIQLRNVPVAFADIPPFEIFGLSGEPALLLGTDLMENFRRVSLDFKDRKVRFQLRKCSEQSILLRTSPFASRLRDDVKGGC